MGRILVIGASNTDLVVTSERLPRPGESVIGNRFATFAGGKGANQAVAARRAGSEVAMMMAVGDDLFGGQMLKNMEAEGIDASLAQVIAGEASGVALIMVGQNGENMISVALGANLKLEPQAVEKVDFSRYTHVLLQLEIPLATVCAAAHRAKDAGCSVILTPAPVSGELPADLYPAVDLLLPNRGELELITRHPIQSEADLAEAARKMHALGSRAVLVTLGAEGSLLFDAAGAHRFGAIEVNAVDTVGAGDCFSGSLAAALAEGRPMQDAVRFATAAAALSVQRPGAQCSYCQRTEIDEFLAKTKIVSGAAD